MKFATLKYQEISYPCLVDTDKNQFWPISDLIADFNGDMNQLVSQYAALRDRLAPVVPGRDLAQATVLAPIPRPRRNLFCVGRNYHAHARELSETVFRDSNKKRIRGPLYLPKFPNALSGLAKRLSCQEPSPARLIMKPNWQSSSARKAKTFPAKTPWPMCLATPL